MTSSFVRAALVRTIHGASTWLARITVVACFCLSLSSTGRCQDEAPGLQDLNDATTTKLSARQLQDLEKVVELCESALTKGLDDDNKTYAEDLLSATLYEECSRLCRVIFDQQPPNPQWPDIRKLCLPKLNRALELRPKMASSQLLLARLLSLPGGDRAEALVKVNQAIALLEDDPDNLSEAHLTRARLHENHDEMKKDLDVAIELNPRNFDAWRTRGLFYLSTGETEKALSDLRELLEQNPDDVVAHQFIAQAFRQLKQYDEAIEHLDKITENDPNALVAFELRARIAEERGDLDAAIDNLNQAIRINPRYLNGILSRARLRLAQEQMDLAQSDINRALQLQPGLPQAILLRSLVYAAQNRFGEAIGDLQQLLRRSENENAAGVADIKLQMGTYYELDQRPRKAIETYTEILTATPDFQPALRRRGDAYLSVGKHAEAIQDYEAAMKLTPDDPGILNNLAWVLATSPRDEVRDGKRAIEIAQKACDLTEFKLPHMISTLAAAYAETGNFDEAIKWSEKAVSDDTEEQLSKELESYREKKAWRELQELQENPAALNLPNAANSNELPNFDLDKPQPVPVDDPAEPLR
ncbi:MAG: tetratricopeptide repeat protein [Planctomycetales bacterium]|nr:tetratricopeptide repeat protein [Planctomycetales bacterium]